MTRPDLPGLLRAREIVQRIASATFNPIGANAALREIDRAIADARQSETGGEYRNPRNVALDQGYGRPSPSVSAPAREIDIDALLEQIERLDNFSAGITIMTKVADHIHVAALRAALPEIVEKMKVTVDWEKRV